MEGMFSVMERCLELLRSRRLFHGRFAYCRGLLEHLQD